MQSFNSEQSRNFIPAGGFTLLVLMVGVILVSHSYLTRFSTQFKPIPRYSDPNAMPWEENFLIRNESLYGYGLHTRQAYSPELPKITKAIPFKAQVYQNRYQRGEIQFAINREGDIQGSWNADFTAGQRHSQQIHCTTINRTKGRYPPNTFRGNIAPSKIYQDENGQDKSKLYFISKGKYLLRTRDLLTYELRDISGDIYVTGWIDPNYNAAGELTLTSMSVLAATFQPKTMFDWKAMPLDPNTLLDLKK